MEKTGLTKMENPLPPEKRRERKKNIDTATIVNQLLKLPIEVKLSVYNTLKNEIQEEQKRMQEKIELITANIK